MGTSPYGRSEWRPFLPVRSQGRPLEGWCSHWVAPLRQWGGLTKATKAIRSKLEGSCSRWVEQLYKMGGHIAPAPQKIILGTIANLVVKIRRLLMTTALVVPAQFPIILGMIHAWFQASIPHAGGHRLECRDRQSGSA